MNALGPVDPMSGETPVSGTPSSTSAAGDSILARGTAREQDVDVPLPIEVARDLLEPTGQLATTTAELAQIVRWLSSHAIGPAARRQATMQLYAHLGEVTSAFEHFADALGVRETIEGIATEVETTR